MLKKILFISVIFNMNNLNHDRGLCDLLNRECKLCCYVKYNGVYYRSN